MGCGPSYVTQEGDYMKGNHVQFKTGSILDGAKAAGCAGRLYEGMNITQVTKESVYNSDKFEDYKELGELITVEDFEVCRTACKENWALSKSPKLDQWQGVINEKFNTPIGEAKGVYAHCCLYNDFSCIAVVFYPKEAWDALPKDKAEAKGRANGTLKYNSA